MIVTSFSVNLLFFSGIVFPCAWQKTTPGLVIGQYCLVLTLDSLIYVSCLTFSQGTAMDFNNSHLLLLEPLIEESHFCGIWIQEVHFLVWIEPSKTSFFDFLFQNKIETIYVITLIVSDSNFVLFMRYPLGYPFIITS